MSEAGANVDGDTMKMGLLMESAQAHQHLAETHLEDLRALTRQLDGVVRDEIRRTLVEELRELTVESDRTVRALREMNRTVSARSGAWNLAVLALCAAVPYAIAHYVLPSSAQIAELRRERETLERDALRWKERGGKVDWRLCGETRRLCVRVDAKASVFGAQADYYIAKGY
ncbi:MAG: hypothetical protein M3O06_11075 [Pseudomonadota bacterium]|nr:hypothetical protein [Pseudomonadota bacterium]